MAASAQNTAPLPDPHELLRRAIANDRKLAEARERYSCRVENKTALTDSKGNVKHTNTEVKQQFYVNGIEVDRTLMRDGKELNADQVKKEDERVMKETLKYSNPQNAKKETDKRDSEIEFALSSMELINGRRSEMNGRSVLSYDVTPNPKAPASTTGQKLAQAMTGTVQIDEGTGEIIDLNLRSVKDVKIAGGMIANLHKGLWIHVHNKEQKDGVWLTELAEGSGDARAALFLHPYFRFRQTTSDCQYYSTTAETADSAKPVSR